MAVPNFIPDPTTVDLNIKEFVFKVDVDHPLQSTFEVQDRVPNAANPAVLNPVLIPTDPRNPKWAFQIDRATNQLKHGELDTTECRVAAVHRISLKNPPRTFSLLPNFGGIGITDLRDGKLGISFIDVYQTPVLCQLLPGSTPGSIYLHLTCFDPGDGISVSSYIEAERGQPLPAFKL